MLPSTSTKLSSRLTAISNSSLLPTFYTRPPRRTQPPPTRHTRPPLTLRLRIPESIKRLKHLDIPPQKMPINIPRQLLRIVLRMLPVTNIEYIIQFFQREVFSLRQQKVAEDPAKDIPGCIPAERTRGRESLDQSGPGERENKIKPPRRSSRETHSNIPNIQRKRLSRIRKRHRPLSWRIHHHKRIYRRRNTAQLSSRDGASRLGLGGGTVGDQETKAAPEQTEGHQWEGYEQEVAAPEGVDGVDGGDGEEEVCDAGAEGDEQSAALVEAGVDEDLGRVVGYDVLGALLMMDGWAGL